MSPDNHTHIRNYWTGRVCSPRLSFKTIAKSVICFGKYNGGQCASENSKTLFWITESEPDTAQCNYIGQNSQGSDHTKPRLEPWGGMIVIPHHKEPFWVWQIFKSKSKPNEMNVGKGRGPQRNVRWIYGKCHGIWSCLPQQGHRLVT